MEMRVLFYLPVITPWWFARIVKPVIERLISDAEVHVLAPSPWCNTGIGPTEIQLCADLPDICWHIVNDDGHPTMRTHPAQREGIIDFVQKLAPDYVICRSADFETVQAFPGIVRHITEGAADPLRLGADSFHFTHCPFDHGVLPDLNGEQTAALDNMIQPFWEKMLEAEKLASVQQDYLNEWANLPSDRPVVFLPLEYEHEENFYTMHRIGAPANAQFLQELSEQLGDRVFLALTNHPLNEKYLDNSAVTKVVRANAARMRLLPGKTPIGTRTSNFLMTSADGVILGDSKVYAMAGFHGTAMLRLSRFQTGLWMNAYEELDLFLDALTRKQGAAPDPITARTWFAYHTANNLNCPRNPHLTGADVLDRLDKPFDPDRWESNFAYFAQDWAKAA
ncbi:MAG: hypothetical protein AAGH57_09715 [Pseudomonadota bacterium]